MSAETNKELARRYFEEFFNGRRADLAEIFMTSDYRFYDPQQAPDVVGPKAMADAVAVYQNQLEGHWQVEQILAAENDHVVVRWTGQGVHTAEVMGIPATGKRVSVAAISLLRIAEGKVAEHWCTWDTLGMLQQMGVVPAPGTAAARA